MIHMWNVCGADLLACGASVLTAQHKGSGGPIYALSSCPPVTPQPRQREHHLLLVGHGSMVHGRACTSACICFLNNEEFAIRSDADGS